MHRYTMLGGPLPKMTGQNEKGKQCDIPFDQSYISLLHEFICCVRSYFLNGI